MTKKYLNGYFDIKTSFSMTGVVNAYDVVIGEDGDPFWSSEFNSVVQPLKLITGDRCIQIQYYETIKKKDYEHQIKWINCNGGRCRLQFEQGMIYCKSCFGESFYERESDEIKVIECRGNKCRLHWYPYYKTNDPVRCTACFDDNVNDLGEHVTTFPKWYVDNIYDGGTGGSIDLNGFFEFRSVGKKNNFGLKDFLTPMHPELVYENDYNRPRDLSHFISQLLTIEETIDVKFNISI